MAADTQGDSSGCCSAFRHRPQPEPHRRAAHRATTGLDARTIHRSRPPRLSHPQPFYVFGFRRHGKAGGSPPPTISRHALIGQPDAFGWLARLVEHINRNPTTWIPIAADTHPFWGNFLHQPLDDIYRTGLMERAVVA